jgi:glycosyltransferase involved in cell wall biosynthesis
MRASVVIRSKDEADRLRLTLTSLACQSEAAEVVVVNDGSSDHTAEVLEEAVGMLDLVTVHHERPAGRSGAANAGASRARGDVLIFLDGDTLAAPGLVEQHMDLHRQHDRLIIRGETWHLRCTRLFLDPERGTPRPGEEMKVARMSAAERERSIVTRQQIRSAFETIDGRAQPGIYPGYGPRRLYEIEMDALNSQADTAILWVAAAGSNQSVPRADFIDAGGFHPQLTINEHRELVLRLLRAGLRMVPCGGRSYHMTHRSGWRDPLVDQDWADIFYAAHPIPEVALLPLLWQGLSDSVGSADARIRSLADLAAAAQSCKGLTGQQAVRDVYLHRIALEGTTAR